MRQIYKYPVNEPIVGKIEKFLHIEYQFDEPVIWAIVNDNLPNQSFSVICSGTGWPIADFQNERTYIGTLQDDGGYVWHYFIVPTATVEATRARSYDKVIYTEEPENKDDEFEIDEEQMKALHEMFLTQFLRNPSVLS